MTGDRWLPSTKLSGSLVFSGNEIAPVTRWLAAMLGFYKPVIDQLLVERDEQLRQLRDDRPENEVLTDRKIYFLSQAPVNLLDDIRFALDQ